MAQRSGAGLPFVTITTEKLKARPPVDIRTCPPWSWPLADRKGPRCYLRNRCKRAENKNEVRRAKHGNYPQPVLVEIRASGLGKCSAKDLAPTHSCRFECQNGGKVRSAAGAPRRKCRTSASWRFQCQVVPDSRCRQLSR